MSCALYVAWAMDCDVYHSGDAKRPMPPFLLLARNGATIPDHPEGPRAKWVFWKTVTVAEIAVLPLLAERQIRQSGYVIQ